MNHHSILCHSNLLWYSIILQNNSSLCHMSYCHVGFPVFNSNDTELQWLNTMTPFADSEQELIIGCRKWEPYPTVSECNVAAAVSFKPLVITVMLPVIKIPSLTLKQWRTVHFSPRPSVTSNLNPLPSCRGSSIVQHYTGMHFSGMYIRGQWMKTRRQQDRQH